MNIFFEYSVCLNNRRGQQDKMVAHYLHNIFISRGPKTHDPFPSIIALSKVKVLPLCFCFVMRKQVLHSQILKKRNTLLVRQSSLQKRQNLVRFLNFRADGDRPLCSCHKTCRYNWALPKKVGCPREVILHMSM